jgi:Ca-activated chloride channel homolog
MIRLVHPILLFGGLLVVITVTAWRWLYYKKPRYVYSCISLFDGIHVETKKYDYLLFLLRSIALTMLVMALARFQSPDVRSKIPVQGIDIMLVADVSGSMAAFDDLQDTRTRMEIARSEAIKFIEKRKNDPIGIVLFAQGIVSRCPLTLDKHILHELLSETDIGILNPEGTFLSAGILTAANRLKESHAQSKIMIVLTDGDPTPGDVPAQTAIDVVKKLGIKIYTIGIGSDQGGYYKHPFFGVLPMGYKLNTDLLKKFAHETGGQFFLAQRAQDMHDIYNTIDQLEKSDHEAGYAHFFDYFIYFLWIACFCIMLELILTTWWIRL